MLDWNTPGPTSFINRPDFVMFSFSECSVTFSTHGCNLYFITSAFDVEGTLTKFFGLA